MPQLSTGHVFMSYSRIDEEVMRRVVAFLRNQKIKVWVDNEKLVPGTPIWEKEIERAIIDASAVIVILSPGSKESVWVRREISYAERYDKRIFPVLVRGDEDSSITLRLITRQYVDIRLNEDQGLNSLVAALFFYLEEMEKQERKNQKDAAKLAQAQAELEVAEREAARLRAERETADEMAREKEKSEFAAQVAREQAARLKATREVAEKTKREPAERAARNFAQIKDKLRQPLTYGKVRWNTLVNYLQSIPKNKSKIYISFGLAVLLVSIIAFLFYQKFISTTLFFSGISDGYNYIYFYDGQTPTKMTQAKEGAKNWSPAVSPLGQLYFTSDQNDKVEIYRTKNNGNIEQVTDTPGGASWGPAFDSFGQLYFTSNRNDKVEIYRRKNNGQNEQMTGTPGGASWGPAFDSFGRLYFTSDRTGKAEIYYLNGSQAKKVTDTPDPYASWGPAFDSFGRLYFTSNRTGKAEIYYMNGSQAKKVTDTPDPYASWAPVLDGKNIYFTSNRNVQTKVFLLNDTQAVAVSSFESWTTSLAARYPFSNP